MVFTIDQYTVSYTAVPADPSDTFGERNKDLFGEPHQIVIKENGEVIRTEKRRIKGNEHGRQRHGLGQAL